MTSDRIETLRIPTEQEALLAQRASVTSSCFELLQQGGMSLEYLPSRLLDAFKVEAWKERPTPNRSMTACRDVMEWITSPFPQGLGSTYDILKAILRSSRDARATEAETKLDESVRRPEGNPHGRAGAPLNNTVDNVNSIPERPSGNSKDQGLRRLSEAAKAGDEIASHLLQDVLDGKCSVHHACLAMGWRKPTVTVRDTPDALADAAMKKAKPIELAMRAWRKMPMEDQEMFLEWAARNMTSVADAGQFTR